MDFNIFLCVFLCFLFIFILGKIVLGDEYRFIFPYFRNTVWVLDEYYTDQISKFELKLKVCKLCDKYGNDKIMNTIKYVLNHTENSIYKNLPKHTDNNIIELEEQRLEILRDMKQLFKLL